MIEILELVFLILVLLGVQRYISTTELNWLGLIIPILFTAYVFIKVYVLNLPVEGFWYKLIVGNIILLSQYFMGLEKRKERHQNEINKMKSKDL